MVSLWSGYVQQLFLDDFGDWDSSSRSYGEGYYGYLTVLWSVLWFGHLGLKQVKNGEIEKGNKWDSMIMMVLRPVISKRGGFKEVCTTSLAVGLQVCDLASMVHGFEILAKWGNHSEACWDLEGKDDSNMSNMLYKMCTGWCISCLITSWGVGLVETLRCENEPSTRSIGGLMRFWGKLGCKHVIKAIWGVYKLSQRLFVVSSRNWPFWDLKSEIW